MARKTAARRRRTRETWVRILHEFNRSGLGPAAFCRSRGLPLTTFQGWRRRLEASAPRAGFVQLVAASASNAAKPAHASWSVEVSLPNGTKLRFEG